MPGQSGAGAMNQYVIGIMVETAQLDALKTSLTAVNAQIAQMNASFGLGAGSKMPSSASLKPLATTYQAISGSMQNLGYVTTSTIGNINAVAGATSKATAGVSNLQTVLGKQSTQIQAAAKMNKNEITDMMRRVMLWSTGVGLLFGAISKVRQAWQGVVDFEVGMAELKKVMSDSTPWQTVKDGLFDIGQAMSVNVNDTMKMMQVWAQQGFDARESLELTKIALLGVNSANLETGQSVEFLTSITRSYNIEAKDTMGVLDGIMRVQADYAVTAQGLADGLKITAATANLMGESLANLVGMMTAVGEVTRESGNVVGNSFKTMFARMQQPKTIAVLQRYGILMDELNEAGQRVQRNPFEVFKQIAAMHNENVLTPKEIIDLSLAIGGVRKFKDAIILIEKFGIAESAAAGYLQAYGDAAKASALVQDTLARKAEKMGVAFLELSNTMAEGKFLKSVKSLTDGLTVFFNKINSFAQTSFGGGMIGAMPFAAMGMLGLQGGKRIMQNVRGSQMRELSAYAGMGAVGMTPPPGMQNMLYNIYGNLGKDANLIGKISEEFAGIAKTAKDMAKNGVMAYGEAFHMLMPTAILDAQAKYTAETGITIKKQTGLMRTAGRTFATTLFPSIGVARETGQSAVRLGAMGFAGGVANFVKGVAKFSAMTLVIEGVISALPYIVDGLREAGVWIGLLSKPQDLLSQTLDPASEASKQFIALAETLLSTQQAAADATRPLGEFLSLMTDREKIDAMRTVGDTIAEEIANGSIKNLGKLRNRLLDFFPAEIVPTQYAAEGIQFDIFKFYENELGKQAVEARERLQKKASTIKDEFNKGIGEVIQQAWYTTTEGPGGIPKIKYTDAVLNANVAIDAAIAIAKRLSELTKMPVQTAYGASPAKWMISLIDQMEKAKPGKGMKEAEDALTNYYIKLYDPLEGAKKEFLKNLPEGTEISDKQLTSIVGMNEKAMLSAQLFILEQVTTLSGKRLIDALRGRLPKTTDALEAMGIDLSDALLKSEDKIFIATNKVTAELKKIDMMSILAPSLGVGFSGAQEKLDAMRSYFKEIAVFSISLNEDLNNINNRMDRLGQYAKGEIAGGTEELSDSDKEAGISFDKKLKDIIRDFRGNRIDFVKAIEEQAKILPKGTGGGAKFQTKAMLAVFNLFRDAESVQENIKLLIEKTGAATWKELIPVFNKATDSNFRSEGEIKSYIGSLSALADATMFDPVEGPKNRAKLLDMVEALFGKTGLSGFMDAVVKDLRVPAFFELNKKIRDNINELNDLYGQLAMTNDRYVDNQIKFNIEYQKVLNDYSSQIKDNLMKISMIGSKGTPSDWKKETFEADNELLEAEKKLMLQHLEQIKVLNDQMIVADQARTALDTFRSSLTDLFADVQQWNKPLQGIKGAFDQIAGARLKQVSEDMVNAMISAMDSTGGLGIGGAIIGKQVADPRQTATEMNTLALETGTSTTQNLINSMNALNTNMGVYNDLFAQDNNIQMPGAYAPTPMGAEFAYNIPMPTNRLVSPSGLAKYAGAYVPQAEIPKGYTKGETLGLGLSQILAGTIGSAVAGGMDKQTDKVNIGASMLPMIAALIPGMTPLALMGTTLLGGVLGGILGEDKPSEKENNENLRRIADNTATLAALDQKIINAPAGFRMPAAMTAGGGLQYSVVINVNGAGDVNAVASAVNKKLDESFRRATTDFKSINDQV